MRPAQATAALLHCAVAWLLSGCQASGEVRHAGPGAPRMLRPHKPCFSSVKTVVAAA